MAEAEKELVISPWRKILRFCLCSVIVVVCVYVTLYASVLMLAARKEAELQQRLKNLVPNIEQLANQRVPVEENETARMMREWGEQETGFEADDYSIYLSGQDSSLDLDHFSNEPTLIDQQEILSIFEPFIETQQDFLNRFHIQVDQSSPRFAATFDESGTQRGFKHSHCTMLGLLFVDILVKTKQHKLDAAFRSIKTAWRLIEVFRIYPASSVKAFALQYQTYLVQILRTFDSIPVEWQLKISEFDYQASWKVLQVIDLWEDLKSVRERPDYYGAFSPEILLGKYGQHFAGLLQPYFWLCVLNRFELHITELEWQLSHYPQPCWGTRNDLIEVENKFPSWNTWHHAFGPIYNPFGQVARLEFETERTRVILQLKELQQKSPAGKLPAPLPKIESKVCPGEYWERQSQPDGTFVLKFSHKGYLKFQAGEG